MSEVSMESPNLNKQGEEDLLGMSLWEALASTFEPQYLSAVRLLTTISRLTSTLSSGMTPIDTSLLYALLVTVK